MAEFAEIEGVQKMPLKRHVDDRGYLMEIMRSDDKFFKKFGQIYMTTCNRGVIKAWHMHKVQTDYFFVPFGTAKIGLHDTRENSQSKGKYQVVILGEAGEEALLIIPPLVMHGMMGLSDLCGIINIPTELFNYKQPDEYREPVEKFEDIWTVQNR
jgi:dTDP-4-dehydrorhamnose 3,5-epimerase